MSDVNASGKRTWIAAIIVALALMAGIAAWFFVPRGAGSGGDDYGLFIVGMVALFALLKGREGQKMKPALRAALIAGLALAALGGLILFLVKR